MHVYYGQYTVVDADGDHIRCRWAESNLDECEGACRGFSDAASLNQRNVSCIIFSQGLIYPFHLSSVKYCTMVQI